MAKKTKRINGSRPTRERRPRLDAAALAEAIESQRQELSHALAIVHSSGELLHESYRFERGESDLGYCCDVICTMLKGAIVALQLLGQSARAGSAADRMTLAKALEAQRQVLFHAQAVAQLIRLRLEAHDFRQRNDADLGVVFASVDQALDRTLTALEPLCLGLPIPSFDGRTDEAASRH